MIHLTMQGPRAGQTFCGQPKTEGSFHAFTGGGMTAIDNLRGREGELCQECLEVYDDVMSEEGEE